MSTTGHFSKSMGAFASINLPKLPYFTSKQGRALVRAGATGAGAPTEIWPRVQGTCPDKGAILLNKKNAPKLDN